MRLGLCDMWPPYYTFKEPKPLPCKWCQHVLLDKTFSFNLGKSIIKVSNN